MLFLDSIVQKLRSNFSQWYQWGQSKVLLRFTIARIQTQSEGGPVGRNVQSY